MERDSTEIRTSIDALKIQESMLREQVQVRKEEIQRTEETYNRKLGKLKKLTECKARELQAIIEECEYRANMLEEAKIRDDTNIDMLMRENEELKEGMRSSRSDPEIINCVLDVGRALNLEIHGTDPLALKELTKDIIIESSKLAENLRKAEVFRKNKEKFMKIYTKNTLGLEEKIDTFDREKEEFSHISKELKTLRLEKTNLNAEVKQLSDEFDRLKSQKDAVEIESIQLDQQFASLKESIITYEQLKNKEINEFKKFQKLNNEESQKLENIYQEFKHYEQSAKECREERKEIQGEIASYTSELEDLQEKIKMYTSKASELENHISKINNKATDEQVNVYTELQTVKAEIDTYKAEKDKLKIYCQTSEEKVSRFKEKLAQVKQDLKQLSQDKQKAERDRRDILDQLKEAENLRNCIQQEIYHLKNDMKVLNNTYKSKSRQLSDLEYSVSYKKSEIDQLVECYSDKSVFIEEQKKEICHLQQQITKLEKSILIKSDELDILALKKRKIEEAIQDQSVAFSNTNKSLKKLRDATEKEEKRLELLSLQKSQVYDSHRQQQKLKQDFEYTKSEEDRYKKHLEHLRELISSGEHTLKNLIDSIEKYKGSYGEVMAKYTSLIQEIEGLEHRKKTCMSEIDAFQDQVRGLTQRLKALKVEENTAMVMLGLSGEKSEQVKKKVTDICKYAVEAEAVRGHEEFDITALRRIIRSSDFTDM